MPLYRLLYRSEYAFSDFAGAADRKIAEIVEAAERSNLRDNLTGAIIASDGVFIQALEGPLPALEATFERICKDLRHKRVRLIEFAAAEERVFPEWRMVRVDQQEDVVRLCAGLDIQPGQLDVSRTSAIITLMRAVLTSKTDSGQTHDELAPS
ncbi:BLUF domain-containing protein (plasmid) [Aliirhizobium terrae]|uniref:BLUF domain-containing protein n=1 Tax=Terrirhizobium terrae TaxID=2926709 RepID=UPI00257558A7|nr:BLUF domain-containing protein [Rhizobium sp. CC-CFT758]WJH38421.1 BLUF domain-containing protein [Rhizobium sp. CC-CFT758]